jgi:hypothetical protein
MCYMLHYLIILYNFINNNIIIIIIRRRRIAIILLIFISADIHMIISIKIAIILAQQEVSGEGNSM